MQQTLLLLAYLAANPQGTVLLLGEPDAHLEIVRQRQLYELLSEATEKTGSQILVASHSEVLLNEAAGRDLVVAFLGRPHRIDDRGSQVLKSLRDVPFQDYYQAELKGWVLYLEGSTDLAVLRALAHILAHPAAKVLEAPFVRYVGNQPRKAQEHFHALREACPELRGFALYDRMERGLPQDPALKQYAWQQREIESYICQRETLLSYAEALGRQRLGPLLGVSYRRAVEEAIEEVVEALQRLGKPSPWGPDLKVSEEFLVPVFENFFQSLGLPNEMRKTNFHVLARHVRPEAIDAEVVRVLDRILAVASG